MIEIITKYFLEKALQSSAKTESMPLHGPPTSSTAPSASRARDSVQSDDKASDNVTDGIPHDGFNNNSSSSSGHKSRGSKKSSPTKLTKSSLFNANDLGQFDVHLFQS